MPLGVQHWYPETLHLAAIAIGRYMREFVAREGAFHRGEYTRRRCQVAAAGEEVRQTCEPSRNYHCESLRGTPFFYTANMHCRVVQAQFDHRLTQERAFFFAGVIQGNATRWLGNGNRNSGQASA